MASNNKAVSYIALHPFQGSTAESQLSFTPGETIYANTGQSGDWWWGAKSQNGGKIEGWFPPSYVKKKESVPTPANNMYMYTHV